MIGVIANPAQYPVVYEFFELLKTPWEFYRSDRQYEVLLCAGGGHFDEAAKLVLYYSGRKTHFDDDRRRPTLHQHRRVLSYRGNRIPIYDDSVTFPENGSALLADEDSRQCVAYLDRSGERVLARIGYDLFDEVRILLSVGQPTANANMPALELHIALLRDLITGCGVPLVEVPPVPDGFQLIACLTHDVDHPLIRKHKWDHTMVGFLYRAVFGSLLDVICRRRPVRDLVKNWMAVLKLPFVHLGLAKDFWREFDHRYLELEQGLPSTFFVIPFKGRPGRNSHEPAPKFRAAAYGARDIADALRGLLAAGCEVGLHGIDAWVDSSEGREELEEIRRLTGVADIGVRMHWLYYDQQSPVALEKAGAAYDSTIGYNETVGYRAGTTQAYMPIEASRLIELPLHVMDTALFYPAYLALAPREARMLIDQMADNAVKFGGCLTINWHDRSVAPERLWDEHYRDLIEDLKSRGAWFATAGQAVSWFRKRRSVVFESDCVEPGAVRANAAPGSGGHLPSLRLRIHKAREMGSYAADDYFDTAFDESVDALIPCGVSI
jgi:peptidoglycan/xylan/chitin deacetylase (PgdA/CDA1 family)